ncbi:MAG: hypothetical protein AAGE52_32395 [Myxococcota bacterium]
MDPPSPVRYQEEMGVVVFGLVVVLFFIVAIASFALMGKPSRDPARDERWLRFSACTWALFTWLFSAAGMIGNWRGLYYGVVAVCISGALLGFALFVAAFVPKTRKIISLWTAAHHTAVLLVFFVFGLKYDVPELAWVAVPCAIGMALARSLWLRLQFVPKSTHPF